MKKINKHIEIVRTDIKQCSMRHSSAIKIQAILASYYQYVGISVVNNQSDLELLARTRPDLVFLGLTHLDLSHQGGESAGRIWLSEYLDQFNINYTGSAAAAIKLGFDKASAKAIVQKTGLCTPQFFTTGPGQYQCAQDLPLKFPLFVKPLSAGGGKGIGDDSVVRNFSEFQQKVGNIWKAYGSSSLVEQYLGGREFSVAILEDTAQEDFLVMPIEIITEKNYRGDRVLGARVKSEDEEQVIGVSDSTIRDTVCELATTTYNLLGGRGLGRIDIKMDAKGEAHFLEANFMPAPGTRYFAGACFINEGMDYETVILRIVSLGLTRNLDILPEETQPVAAGSLFLGTGEPLPLPF